jgi:hypothetical protein
MEVSLNAHRGGQFNEETMMLEAERRRTPQANGRRQERRGTERSPALGGGLTLVIQDGQDAYQRVFADVGHGTRGFPASVAR